MYSAVTVNATVSPQFKLDLKERVTTNDIKCKRAKTLQGICFSQFPHYGAILDGFHVPACAFLALSNKKAKSVDTKQNLYLMFTSQLVPTEQV